MKAEFSLHTDKRFKKPYTISVVLRDDLGDIVSSSDIHGRHRDASAARSCALNWVNINEYEIGWGTIEVSSEPPQIKTLED